MRLVKLRVKNAATSKGVANPFQLSHLSKVNYALCYRLWHEQTTQISLSTLSKICNALACDPGDLLVLEKDLVEVGRSK